jgi:hypothetical protein
VVAVTFAEALLLGYNRETAGLVGWQMPASSAPSISSP